jgi:hypothetical protein
MCAHNTTPDLSENEDWLVLKEIYSECLVDDGSSTTLHIPISLASTIAIRILPQQDDTEAARRKEKDEFDVYPNYKYMILSASPDPPMMEVKFDYSDPESPPESMKVSIIQYPKLWPAYHKSQWEDWISKESCNVLEEEGMSFNVCDFIEHKAMEYFTAVDQNSTGGYSAVLFTNFCKYTDDIWDVEESNGAITNVTDIREKRKMNKTSEIIHRYARRVGKKHWKKWYEYECPICFSKEHASEAVELDCGHFYCLECIGMYVKVTISDIQLHRQNPFNCPIPECKKDMKVLDDFENNLDISKRLLSCEQRDRMLLWQKDIDHPNSTSLTICPRSKCRSRKMRRVDNSSANTLVYCEECNAHYCEICLKRCYKKKGRNVMIDHADECDEKGMLKFCRRYSTASDEMKQKCHEKWHWIEEYISSREEDLSARLWLKQNGMACPSCKTGIERSDGCFHMHCSVCGTHFCYECGVEIFAPFYGTHHCWEETLEEQMGVGPDIFMYNNFY